MKLMIEVFYLDIITLETFTSMLVIWYLTFQKGLLNFLVQLMRYHYDK